MNGRRVAMALGLVAVVLIGSGLVERATAADRLTSARQRQQEADSDLDRTAVRLDGLQNALAAVGASRDADRNEATTAAGAATELAGLRDQIAAGQASLANSTAQVGLQTGQVNAAATCVEALDRARDRLTTGQQDAATTILRDATATCQLAQTIAVPGAPANFPYDFADPFVLPVNGSYLAFATNGPGGAIQVLASKDTSSWELRNSALVALPRWAVPGHTWSPAVLGTGTDYLMLYTVRDAASNRECITTARATDPAGPYVDSSTGPFICQPDLGGSIDASPTVAPDGHAYVTWKTEGELIGDVAHIWSQQFDPSTLALTGTPSLLISADQPWESHVVEGPSITLVGSTWVLVYSGGHWFQPSYQVGYATCTSPLGPCTKPAGNTLITSNDTVSGPGGAELYRSTDGTIGIAYAAWRPDNVGWPNSRRLYIGHLAPQPGGRMATN